MTLKDQINAALKEDIGSGDITTIATVPKDIRIRACMVAKDNGILAGLTVAEDVFRHVDKKLVVKNMVKDGMKIRKNQVLAEIYGNARSILSAERVALNFIQRLSGIATLTGEYKKKLGNKRIEILDTRKTTPLFRILEKYAVMMGGGANHRFGLFDGILIKDNHIKIDGSIRQAVLNVKKKYPGMPVEVEVQNLKEVKEAALCDIDIIMLDNMNIADIKNALKILNGRFKIEVSGGINIKNISKYSRLKIDYISIGSLTHSAKSFDISLDVFQMPAGSKFNGGSK